MYQIAGGFIATTGLTNEDDATIEEHKKVAIAKHRRALKNNLTLFQNGEIEADDYYRQKDHHERQITYWEARTSDKQKITLQLTTTIEMMRRLKDFWGITSGEDRKLLAHSLFDEIIYDLDRKRIVDFTVKSWAEPFLVLRAALYEDEMTEEMKNRFNSGLSSKVSYYSPNGTRNHTIIIRRYSTRIYFDDRAKPKQRGLQSQSVNTHTSFRWEGLSELALAFGITAQRVHQIIQFKST